MGYRLYLATMPKKEYEEMIKMSKKDFITKYSKDGDDCVSLSEITKVVYELGKYVDYSDYMHDIVVFDDNFLNKQYEEYCCYVCNKDIIKTIINDYRSNTVKYYSSLLNGINNFGRKKTPEKKKEDINNHFLKRISIFSDEKLFNVEEGQPMDSWEYEYSIFDLIRIYRELKDDEVLLYYGY